LSEKTSQRNRASARYRTSVFICREREWHLGTTYHDNRFFLSWKQGLEKIMI